MFDNYGKLGLQYEDVASFTQDLSRAIFVNIQADEQGVREFHSGTSRQAMAGDGGAEPEGPSVLERPVRRMRALEEVLEKYSAPSGLNSSGKPILTEHAWQVLEATKALIDSGSCCGTQWKLAFGMAKTLIDFGITELWLLDEVQQICSAAGFPDPLPNYKSRHQMAVDKVDPDEPFDPPWATAPASGYSCCTQASSAEYQE
eukprot:gene12896-13022_t